MTQLRSKLHEGGRLVIPEGVQPPKRANKPVLSVSSLPLRAMCFFGAEKLDCRSEASSA